MFSKKISQEAARDLLAAAEDAEPALYYLITTLPEVPIKSYVVRLHTALKSAISSAS